MNAIWRGILWPEVAVIADLDGVLTEDGQTQVSEDLRPLFQLTPVLSFVASGRPLEYCWEVGSQIHARGVFAENGLRYQFTGVKDGKIYAEPAKAVACRNEIPRLKELIGFEVTRAPRAKVTIEGDSSPVLFELGKKEMLTLATREVRDQGLFVSLNDCRWTAQELHELSVRVIRSKGLRVAALGPYRDGNIDYQPADQDGQPYGKRIIPQVIRQRFPWVKKIVVLVDGPNDVQLAADSDVFPVTFGNGCDATKKAVEENGGLVLESPGYEGGCVQAMQYIRQEFLGLEPLDLQIFRERREQARSGNYRA